MKTVIQKKLEDLCDFINGGAWSDSEYVNFGIPVLKVSNFNVNSFSLDSISYLSINDTDKYERNKLQQNDLVIATVGSHQSLINSAAGRTIAINSMVAGYYLNQNAVCIRSKNTKELDQKYLVYLGKTEFFRNYIQTRGKGAANQMRIAIGDIKNFPVNLPTLENQKKIAAILSAYDDLIENNLKQIRLLEEMAQITYQEWFVRLKFPNHENTPIDETTGLPIGWEEINIGKLVDYEIGGGWGEDELSNDFSEPAYVIRGTDIDELSLGGKIDNVPFRYHKPSNLKSRKLQKLDIVFEVSGGSQTEGVAKTILITEELLKRFNNDVMCASFCKLVRLENENNAYFFLHYLRFLRTIKATEVFEIKGASSIINYNWTGFLKFQKIILPNSEIIETFNNKVSSIHKEINTLGSQNQLLKEARDILLPRLMTGKITVE